MPLFFAIEPSNESDGRNEFEIPAAWSGCLCLCSPLTPSQPSSPVCPLTSADQPVSALPLDPIDGEVALNVAAFARIATPILPESLLQIIAGPMRFEPTASSVTSWRSKPVGTTAPKTRWLFALRALPIELLQQKDLDAMDFHHILRLRDGGIFGISGANLLELYLVQGFSFFVCILRRTNQAILCLCISNNLRIGDSFWSVLQTYSPILDQ